MKKHEFINWLIEAALKTKEKDMEDVKSPCIKVCQHDSNGICYGCRRTREEVGDWGLYTNEQKQAVLDQLSLRKNSDDGPTGFMR